MGGRMNTTRRTVIGGLAATALSACGGPAYLGGRVSAQSEPQMQPVPDSGYDAWVASFRQRAAGQGIPSQVLDSAFRGAGFLPGVIERDRNQTEFNRSFEDYLALVADENRVATGRAMMSRHGSLLAGIENRFGVRAEIVAAIWGVESRFGERRGSIPVVSSTSTLAYEGRRGSFFEQQLMAALRILANGDVSAPNMTGSWAGAMGHTQFIPTSYQAYAVDFTGDGRRDIWSEDPTDALASTAAYLNRSGWQAGRPWGLEVVLPQGSGGLAGQSLSASDWTARGVRAASGAGIPGGSPQLRLPQGTGGPAFLVYDNFRVIGRYNGAENYMLAVGYLADRLAGGGPLRGSFPPDAYGLTIDDRRELQQRLTAAGFDTQGTDGVIGPDTRAAISAYQQSRGISVTGEPSRELLARLR